MKSPIQFAADKTWTTGQIQPAMNTPAHTQPDSSQRARSKPGEHSPARLCWTRQALVNATGLSYRTIINLEKRGLLARCLVGVNVACYSDASVRALFGDPAAETRPAS
jgi:hypothetical protein